MPTHHHKTFTSSDIKKYLDGELSAMERHELERAALDDPFLADAIDGFAAQYAEGTNNMSEDVAGLREMLKAKTTGGKVIPLKRTGWWRIAAVIILLAGTGMLVFTLLNNNTKETASLAQRDTRPSKPADEGYPVSADSSTREIVASASPKVAKESMKQPAQSDQPVEEPTSAAAEVATRQAAAETVAANQANERLRQEGYTTSRNRSLVDAEKIQVQELKGKVTDPENRPIEGAEITMNNNRVAATSDRAGNFVLKTPDTAVEALVNAEGYKSESVMLKKNAPPVPVILQEAASMRTVDRAEGTEREKKTTSKAVIEPVGGWQQFETYVTRNRKQPKSGRYVAGEVHLSFSINKNGRPEQVKILKPLSDAENAEAIRLLKAGPDWIMISPGETNATIVIKF